MQNNEDTHFLNKTKVEMNTIEKHDIGDTHVIGSTISGSKSTKNPRECILGLIKTIESFIQENEYVSLPAKLALVPIPNDIKGVDVLIKKDVSEYYNNMPTDMVIDEIKTINESLTWEMRAYAEIPIIVDSSVFPKKATHFAAILGPNYVIWTVYPVDGINGVAPQINKENVEFWKAHVFAKN